jgi:hypothetical protein
MRPDGRFSMLCFPVMALLSAADELADNLSSELSKRQRIRHGESPPSVSQSQPLFLKRV